MPRGRGEKDKDELRKISRVAGLVAPAVRLIFLLVHLEGRWCGEWLGFFRFVSRGWFVACRKGFPGSLDESHPSECRYSWVRGEMGSLMKYKYFSIQMALFPVKKSKNGLTKCWASSQENLRVPLNHILSNQHYGVALCLLFDILDCVIVIHVYHEFLPHWNFNE